jgi:hypothetical protein
MQNCSTDIGAGKENNSSNRFENLMQEGGGFEHIMFAF